MTDVEAINIANIEAAALINAASIQAAATTTAAHTQATGQVEAANIQSKAETLARGQAAAATIKAAEVQAAAQIQSAQIDAESRNYAASQQARAQTEAAGIVAAADTTSAATQASAQIQAAGIDAASRTAAAATAADAQIQSAGKSADAELGAAAIGAQAQAAASQVDANAKIQSAQVGANATIQAAQSGANAEVTAANLRAEADKFIATLTQHHEVEVANIEAQSRRDVAVTTGQFSNQAVDKEGSWRTAVSGTEKTASDYRADREFAGVKYREDREDGRLATKLNFAETKFALLQPLIEQMVNASSDFLSGGGAVPGFNPTPARSVNPAPMGFSMGRVTPSTGPESGMSMRSGPSSAMGDQLGHYSSVRMGPLEPAQDGGQGGGGSAVAGTVSITAPYITTRGVFTPAMLQQQVNAAYARNDARTASQVRKSEGDLAGRGFSSNSPLLDAIRVGLATANMRASVEAASKIRLDAAQANTDAVHRAQVARSDQYLKQEGVLIDAQRNEYTRQVGILNAVSSLVGGIL